jgi:oligopeptide transport system substrate-binding protein
MPHFFRNALPYFAGGVLLAALAWAMSFGTLPPADFTFDNGNEIETLDPALATGQPEHRILDSVFEGLLRREPPEGWETKYPPEANVPMKPVPAMAESYELSDDGRTYTFTMRADAKWSNGEAVTADDFAWSWMRTLHPETGSKYAYQLYYLVGAENYNLTRVAEGDRVEVELDDRENPIQLFPRGTIRRGIVRTIHKPPEPKLPESASDDEKSKAAGDWKEKWVYAVEIKPLKDGQPDWDAPGEMVLFSKKLAASQKAAKELQPPLLNLENVQPCRHVLIDFESSVGVNAENPRKLVVTLKSRTPFFPDLLAFYPLYPVNKECITRFGTPDWTRPENIVTNGPFTLQFRRIRDRVRLAKNPLYWDKDRVKLDVVDAYAVKSETTSLNMYLNGQLDWATVMPPSTIPVLKRKLSGQFRGAPELTTYFYRINVGRPELKDPRVRRALAMAIDKQRICEQVTRGGELPAGGLVPPIPGYQGPTGLPFDPAAAKKLLAEAGYPDGRGLPTVEILYNDLDVHRTIAETIQQMWRENLGVDSELRGLEWGVYLASTHSLDYEVARAGWVADYADPNTFLDMFQTDNENNQTGWGNPKYDELIKAAAAEEDATKRLELLSEAEKILIDEQPIIPIYYRVSKNLVQPHVKGFFNNVQDEHPLKLLQVER